MTKARVSIRMVKVKPEVLYALAAPIVGASELLCVEVTVRSALKPTGLMVGRIDTADFKSQADAKKRVETLAGALAETICERFGDTFLDPDVCAVDAGKLWAVLLQQPKSQIGVA